jgi:hypothetical protein
MCLLPWGTFSNVLVGRFQHVEKRVATLGVDKGTQARVFGPVT